MEKLTLNQILCSSENDRKSRITLMEEYPSTGRRRNRYRVRAYGSVPQDKDSKGKRVVIKSREVQYQMTATILHWVIRSRFLSFTLLSVLLFIFFTFVFAFIIVAVAEFEPRCVTSTIFEMDDNFSHKLNDAYALSWTTFSTVGFGAISPSTSAMFTDDPERFRRSSHCFLMSFVLSFESLVGILLVSFSGAILFIKLIQFQSHAQVKFSSVMVVKYGDGVELGDIDDDEDDGDGDEQSVDSGNANAHEKIPCPILIFRMANLLSYKRNGEIVNAHVNTVATVNIKNATASYATRSNTVYRNALNILERSKKEPKLYTLSKRIMGASSTINNSTRSRTSNAYSSSRMKQSSITTSSTSSTSAAFSDRTDTSIDSNTTLPRIDESSPSNSDSILSKMHVEMTDEEIFESLGEDSNNGETYLEREVTRNMISIPSLGNRCMVHREAQLEIPDLVFAKVKVTPERHPFFRTSWRAVHTLNAESPLLNKETRKRIENTGGYWPSDMNNKKDVYKSIDFDQFLVTFRGLSKATGNEVYEHQVYTKENIKVGSQFESILVQNPNGTIGVEPDSIDEIRNQNGESK